MPIKGIGNGGSNGVGKREELFRCHGLRRHREEVTFEQILETCNDALKRKESVSVTGNKHLAIWGKCSSLREDQGQIQKPKVCLAYLRKSKKATKAVEYQARREL